MLNVHRPYNDKGEGTGERERRKCLSTSTLITEGILGQYTEAVQPIQDVGQKKLEQSGRWEGPYDTKDEAMFIVGRDNRGSIFCRRCFRPAPAIG